MPLRIFVSSTRRDLEREHRAVVDHIRALGHEPVTMFEFGAAAQPPASLDADKVGSCALFVLILAHRYGESPAGEPRSFTELEYEEARKRRLPRLIFLIDEDQAPLVGTGSRHNRDDGDDWTDRYKQLQKLKGVIRERNEDTPTPFVDTAMLTAKVVRSIREWTEQHSLSAEPGRTSPADRAPTYAEPRLLSSYSERLREQHSSLPLIGFPKSVRIELPLVDLYVPLHAVPAAQGKGRSYGGAAEAHSDETLRGGEPCVSLAVVFSLAARQGDRRGFVLLGDPGSGKTTHLRRMALACVTDRRGPSELGLPDDVVPLFLPLRLLREDDDLDLLVPILLARGLEPSLADAARILQPDGRFLFLFDGLDEVPRARRATIARRIEQLLQTWPRSYFAVTSRYAGYRDEVRLDAHFLELHLRPLSDEAIAQFVHNWYRIVERQTRRQGADERAATSARDLLTRLDRAVVASQRIDEMAANPLLLTIICLVHRDRGRILPDSRYELYEDCMAVLLERWRAAKELAMSWSAADAEALLRPVALHLHCSRLTRLPGQALEPIVAKAMQSLRSPGASATAFLEQIRDESGVLVGWSNDQFGFLHLGFQEHLAAKQLAAEIQSATWRPGPNVRLEQLVGWYGDSWWEEVLLLLLGRAGADLFEPFFQRLVTTPQFAANQKLLQACLAEAGRPSRVPFESIARRAPGLVGRWLAKLTKGRVGAYQSHLDAAATARWALSLLSGQTDSLAAQSMPGTHTRVVHGVELLSISAGEFWMGDEAGASDERPRRRVNIRPFWLARTTVTNAQYRAFVEATGYERPATWKDRRLYGDTQPVVGVSWQDAQAYCRWAGLRLPTEAEWEYACRAGTTTPFSFGANITPEQVNYDGNLPYAGGKKGEYRQRTVPVGSLPANAWGLHEMHGNVWEWCEDWLGDYRKAPTDGSAQQKDPGSGLRVLRGGSWLFDARGCRSAFRDGGPPGLRSGDVGFRPASSSL